MKKALLDTSFLMYYVQRHASPLDAALRLEGVAEVHIPLCVIKELWQISGYRGKRGRRAAIALKYFETALGGNVKVVDCSYGESVDESLLELAKRCGYILLTADIELKHRAEGEGVEAYSPVSSKAGRTLA